MKYFKKAQNNSQGIMAAGVLYNNTTVTRYEDNAVPHDVNSFYRQNLLNAATEKEWVAANATPIKKEEAPTVIKERLTLEDKPAAKAVNKPTPPNKPKPEMKSTPKPEKTDVEVNTTETEEIK